MTTQQPLLDNILTAGGTVMPQNTLLSTTLSLGGAVANNYVPALGFVAIALAVINASVVLWQSIRKKRGDGGDNNSGAAPA